MSPKLPRLTAAELLRALNRDGWQEVRRSGSHVHLKHGKKSGRVTIAAGHLGITLKPKTLATILAQAGLTAEELRDLL